MGLPVVADPSAVCGVTGVPGAAEFRRAENENTGPARRPSITVNAEHRDMNRTDHTWWKDQGNGTTNELLTPVEDGGDRNQHKH